MILHIFDDTFTYRGRVENWISLTWTEEFKGEGKFTLITYDTDKYAELLRHGWYFYRNDRPTAMVSVKVERNTENNTITVCGYTALHMLSRRIIGLPYSGLNVEESIYGLINGDLRGLPYVSTAAAKGLTEEYECEIEGTVMLDGVLEILNESSYGIRANFDYKNKQNVIEVYEGVDRSYSSESGGTVFSQEFGNLKSLVVTEDDDLFKNVAYVTGSAKDSSETIYYQCISEDAGERENWREMLVTGENQQDGETNEQWKKKQKQIGLKALQEHKNAKTFEVELAMDVFGQKYELGDKVTCKSKRYGIQFDTQITQYNYEYKKGVEKVKITLGNKPTDYVKGAIIKHG